MAGNYEVYISKIILIADALIFHCCIALLLVVCFAGTKRYFTPVTRVRNQGEFAFSLSFVSVLTSS